MKEMKEQQLKEWNDTHIPRGRVGHHATGIPKKYWIAIGDDVLINNYSEFVNQSLQLKPLAGNATPSFTTQDIMKAKELALRTVKKFPGKYVFFGVDDTSRGMMTGKNHLRASVRYYYDPTVRMWNDNELFGDSEKDAVNEADNQQEIALAALAKYCDGIKDKLANSCDVELEIPNRIANFCGWLSIKHNIHQLSPTKNNNFFNLLQDYSHKNKLTGKKCDPDKISIHDRIANFIGYMFQK